MKQAYRTDTSSLAASVNGAAFKMERMLGVAVQFKWTDGGSLNGTFKLQGSNNAFVDNPTAPENANATWEDLAGSTITATTSDSDLINVSDIQYQAVRWVFTRTAGTGSVEIVISAKGRN